jgi:hypothetical protein
MFPSGWFTGIRSNFVLQFPPHRGELFLISNFRHILNAVCFLCLQMPVNRPEENVLNILVSKFLHFSTPTNHEWNHIMGFWVLTSLHLCKEHKMKAVLDLFYRQKLWEYKWNTNTHNFGHRVYQCLKKTINTRGMSHKQMNCEQQLWSIKFTKQLLKINIISTAAFIETHVQIVH